MQCVKCNKTINTEKDELHFVHPIAGTWCAFCHYKLQLIKGITILPVFLLMSVVFYSIPLFIFGAGVEKPLLYISVVYFFGLIFVNNHNRKKQGKSTGYITDTITALLSIFVLLPNLTQWITS